MDILVTAGYVALVVLFYDSLVTGPAVVRIAGAGALGMGGVYALGHAAGLDVVVPGVCAGFLGLLGVALLQLVLMQRDAAVAQVYRRSVR